MATTATSKQQHSNNDNGNAKWNSLSVEQIQQNTETSSIRIKVCTFYIIFVCCFIDTQQQQQTNKEEKCDKISGDD